MAVIEAQNLYKSYGNFEAVKDVSFSVGNCVSMGNGVSSGTILGLLGPNGAGKTTIMKIITGFHYPSMGAVKIDGISVEEDPVEVKRRIGYLPENNPLYGDLSPMEYLDFIAKARLIGKNDRVKAINNALAVCGLEEVKTRRIDKLSKGYRQRVGLGQAIIHDPDILILDEPTSGLDPNQIIEIRSVIRELGKKKTVILSTHILSEVEAVCDTVLILNNGRIAAQGTPEDIALDLKSSGQDTWSLCLKGNAGRDTREAVEKSLENLGNEIDDLLIEPSGNGIIRLSFSMKASPELSIGNSASGGELIFDWALAEGYKILEMNHKKLSLEDLFVKLTSGGI